VGCACKLPLAKLEALCARRSAATSVITLLAAPELPHLRVETASCSPNVRYKRFGDLKLFEATAIRSFVTLRDRWVGCG